MNFLAGNNFTSTLAITFTRFILMLCLVCCSLAHAQDMNIPGNWQHKQNGGQHIFIAPGGAEGVSINPAQELASLGDPMRILNNVLDQIHSQYAQMQVMEECYGDQNMAVAILQRPGNNGLVSERLMVSTGQGSATIVLFWAPTANFQAEDMKLTKGDHPAHTPNAKGIAKVWSNRWRELDINCRRNRQENKPKADA